MIATEHTVKSRPQRLLWLSLLLILFGGCRGCDQQSAKTEKEKKEEAEKKKQRLAADELRTLPFASETVGNFVKPGHWYQANNKLKANQQDESLTASLMIYNRDRRPVPMFPSSAPIEFHRGLSLAKTQEKNISLKFYQPDVATSKEEGVDSASNTTPAYLRIDYSVRGVGTPVRQDEFPLRLLAGYQYNIITLSVDPARYVFWRGLDCIVWPSNTRMAEERYAPHRLIDLNENEVAAQFPDKLYFMTSVSHVVINDASPTLLSVDQQRALLDWLHFGGTLILNGPDSIGGIDSSFLKEYAPLKNTRASELSDTQTQELNRSWTIKQMLAERVPFAPEKTVPLLAGELSDSSRWMNSLEGLVAERLVGQGRVVMTTFPMTDSAFLRWPSYSSFIHNAILRKPYRDVTSQPDSDTKYAESFRGTEMNPLHSTRLRLWARDLDATMISNRRKDRQADVPRQDRSARFPESKKSSLGAWNSQSEIMLAARNSLQESSGITVPRIGTIIKLLTGYLIVLVPLNWLVFRLMGRVELSWVAAPLIAVVGAFVVARSVQLDVGFSRSQNSYGFLECHANYPRGLLSSYTALYTSLSTNYKALYEEDAGVVSPMPSPSREVGAKKRISASQYDYNYADNDGAGLQNNPVMSNTTGLIQSEEMVSLGGSLRASFNDSMDEVTVTSDMDLPLLHLGIVGVSSEGGLRMGWLGTVNQGEAKKVRFMEMGGEDRWFEEWNRTPILSRPDFLRADGSQWTQADVGEDLYLGSMLELLATKYPLGRGEYIAVGCTDKSLGSLKIIPESKQSKQKSLVLIHLKPADLQPVRPDTRIFPRKEEEKEESVE